MYFCDSHTHSQLSPDSDAPLESMARQAVSLGLSALYVTDHCDLVDGTGRRVTQFDWPAAQTQLGRARKEVQGQLDLRLGLELGSAVLDPVIARDILAQGGDELDFVLIVMPEGEELTLKEPKILKQNGKYGIRLKATAPSIHMIRTQIYTEITPIVGSEQQSEELVLYLLKEFEEDPVKIWESNIFGKSLHSLVSEGMHNKLYRMPVDARDKVRETIERVINEGCSGLLCIIL